MTVENIWNDDKIFRAPNKQKYEKDANYEITSENFKALQMCAVVCSDASFNLNLPESKKEELLLRVQKEKLSEQDENRLF